jgi:hypothetical protein
MHEVRLSVILPDMSEVIDLQKTETKQTERDSRHAMVYT